MKIRNLLFLVVLFTMLLIPNSVMASSISNIGTVKLGINNIEIDASEIIPLGGESPKELVLGEDVEYEIQSQSWEDSTGTILTAEDKFVIGDTYLYRLSITPKEGYKFDLYDIETNVVNISCQSTEVRYESEELIHIAVTCIIPKLCTITVEASEGLNVTTTDGNFTVYQGYSKELSITVEEGYELDSIKVDGEQIYYEDKIVNDTYVQLSNERKTILLREVADDITISLKAEKWISIDVLVGGIEAGKTPKDVEIALPGTDEYEIKECNWYTLILGETEEDYDFELLEQDEKFEEGKKYYVSLVLAPKQILSSSYIKAIVNGEEADVFIDPYDNICIEARNAFNAVMIEDEKDDNSLLDEKEDNSLLGEKEEEPDTNKTSNNPPTSDNIAYVVAILVVSIIGIGVTTILRKK